MPDDNLMHVRVGGLHVTLGPRNFHMGTFKLPFQQLPLVSQGFF